MTLERVLIFQRDADVTDRLGKTNATAESISNARQMLETVQRLKPSVVVMQLEALPSPTVRAVELIMSENPTPILLVGEARHGTLALDLMKRGALEVTEFPTSTDPQFVARVAKQIALLSTVKVVKHTLGSRRNTSSRLTSLRLPFPVIAIASSLGGPRALSTLLASIPLSFKASICVCQHITTGFSSELSRWLASETGHVVHEATNGIRVTQGEIFIAPSNSHLTVSPTGQLILDQSPPVGGFKPSGDVLLKSVARSFGARAIGAVLTGMGADGAAGLLEIRKAGGHTVAQDEESCIVFGMPKAAIDLNAAEVVLPLVDIADRLMEWLP